MKNNYPPVTYPRLPCDIHLGGSTAQFLNWGKENLSKEEFIESIKSALISKARTKPLVMSRRLACLIGLTYDKLSADTYILDCVIAAFYKVEMELS